MAAYFPLYTDADIHGPLVDGLIRRGWDVVRAIDAHREGEADDVHFVAAATAGRVLVSNDEDQIVIARTWVREGRPFVGLITWKQLAARRHSVGAFIDAFEQLAATDDPFRFSKIVWLKPAERVSDTD